MLPTIHFSDAGYYASGITPTIYGGPFTGPDIVQETNLAFYDLDRNCTLQDAIATVSGGAAPTYAHAYLLAVGDVNNVVEILQSSEILPSSVYRSVPAIKFTKGERLLVRGVQMTNSGSGVEATQLMLRFAPRAEKSV